MIDRIPNNYAFYTPGGSERKDSLPVALRESLHSFKLQLDGLFKADVDFFNSQNLTQVAQTIVKISTLSQRAEDSEHYKTTGSDIQQILKASPSKNNPVSLLKAASHYLEDPSSQELSLLLKEYHHNRLATQNLLSELSYIADELNHL